MSTSDQTRNYYDRHASAYDLRTGLTPGSGHDYNLRRYYEPFLDRELPRTGKVLELGCGTGFYTRGLLERGLEVVAMDISPNMVEQARLRCPEGITFLVGNCEEPGAALSSELVGDGFDSIIGINTFSYYPHKLAALKNYATLLRKGGRLIILDMNGTSYTQRLAYLFNYREARQFRRNIDESTPRSLALLLKQAGFSLESVERFSFVPNSAGKAAVALITPFDRLLSHLPLAESLAIRISVVARRAS